MHEDEPWLFLINTIRTTDSDADLEVTVERAIQLLSRLACLTWGETDTRWISSQPVWLRATRAIQQDIRSSEDPLAKFLYIAAKSEPSLEEVAFMAEMHATHSGNSREHVLLRRTCTDKIENVYREATERGDIFRGNAIDALWKRLSRLNQTQEVVGRWTSDEPEVWAINDSPEILAFGLSDLVQSELSATRQAGHDVAGLLLAPARTAHQQLLTAGMEYCDAVLKSFGLLAVVGLSGEADTSSQLKLAQQIRQELEELDIVGSPLYERILLVIRSLSEHESHCRYRIDGWSG